MRDHDARVAVCETQAARITELHAERTEILDIVGYCDSRRTTAIGLIGRLRAIEAEVYPLHHELSLAQTRLHFPFMDA
jgi:hypothetical protein